ncbi:hypothetical protein [Clostridium butyricum]|uniref:hypothetical protein n=1 Tax=Clostridium butyricum TaxID=1492 RepID=UPI0002CA909D|nr:hypothetical protein [Clostridium butyricum]EMU52589.1 hypothetical protein CBDKU1_34310 [Clostridium butyricum DKU-01]
MAVKITVKGNNETNEYKDAKDLEEIFRRDLTNDDINGEVLIISNATLFGQETKDIDLIVVGYLDNYDLLLNAQRKEALTINIFL